MFFFHRTGAVRSRAEGDGGGKLIESLKLTISRYSTKLQGGLRVGGLAIRFRYSNLRSCHLEWVILGRRCWRRVQSARTSNSAHHITKWLGYTNLRVPHMDPSPGPMPKCHTPLSVLWLILGSISPPKSCLRSKTAPRKSFFLCEFWVSVVFFSIQKKFFCYFCFSSQIWKIFSFRLIFFFSY